MIVFDTGEPQGSSPSTASDQPAGGVSPLNLDRLALDVGRILAEPQQPTDEGDAWWWSQPWLDAVARDVLSLVDRVRALEAVTQAAREYLFVLERTTSPAHRDLAELNLQAALAVVDGGGAADE